MLSNLATTPFICACSGASAAGSAIAPASHASYVSCVRPAMASFTSRDRQQLATLGMVANGNHIKVWPLGPEDGSTG